MVFGQVQRPPLGLYDQDAFEERVEGDVAGSDVEDPSNFGEVVENG